MLRAVAKHERADVVIFRDEDTTIGQGLRQQRCIARIVRPFGGIENIVPVAAQSVNGRRDDVRVGEQPHLFRGHGEPICVGALSQARAVEQAGVNICGFQHRIRGKDLLPRRAPRQQSEHHRGRDPATADDGLAAHLSRFSRDPCEQ